VTTTEDTRLAWEEVADRLESLGLKLKLHFEQAESSQHPVEEVSKAFARLGTAIESSFASIGTAIKDPAVRDDANTFATALGDALADTFSKVSEELAGAANGLRCKNGSSRPDATADGRGQAEQVSRT